MFGSNWPVCLLRGAYAEWTRAVKELAASLSPGEQAALWGGYARRFYQL